MLNLQKNKIFKELNDTYSINNGNSWSQRIY